MGRFPAGSLHERDHALHAEFGLPIPRARYPAIR